MTINNTWDWRVYCGKSDCSFFVHLNLKDLKNFFDSKFKREIYEKNRDYDINIFSFLYDEIMCGKCESFPLHIINNKHEYILDPDNIVPCERCEKPILLTRLKAVKNTKICTVCARGNEMNESEKIKIFNDTIIPKSPPIPPEMSKCEKCGSDSTTRYVQSTGNWFLGCSTFPKCWWRKNLPQIGEVKGANIIFNMKGTALELLNAAKEACKVKNKKVVNDILEEMNYRKENRIIKGKSQNLKLNEYLLAVERYKRSLDE